MWGTRESFPLAVSMVVIVAVGSWSLGHVSTVGIIYIIYGINFFVDLNIYASIMPCLILFLIYTRFVL